MSVSFPVSSESGFPNAGRHPIETIQVDGQTHLALALKAAQMVAWSVDLQTWEVRWSDQPETAFGFPPNSFGNTLEFMMTLVHPDDRERAVATVERAIRGEANYALEFRLLHPAGHEVWVYDQGEVQRDAAGNPLYLVGVAQNIHRRKQTEVAQSRIEQELRHANHRVTTVLESMTDAFVAVDRDWRIIYVNQTTAQMNQVSPEELVGRSYWEVWSATVGTICEENYRRAMAEQIPVHFEYFYLARQRWYEIHAYPSPEGLGIYYRDINDRKQAEQGLQQQLAEIEAIYQSAPVGLSVLDTDLRFVRINQRLAEMNGLPVEAHIGRRVRELLPDLADTAERILRPILETGEPLLNVEITGETPAQPGVQRTWMEHFLPLKDGDRVIGISTVCEEITERKQTEKALHRSEERYRSLFESIDEGFCVVELVFDPNHQPIDYRFLEVNPMFEQQTGLKQAIGKTARQLVPDLENYWFEIYGSVALTGEPLRFESGSEAMNRWFDVYAFPLQIGSHKVAILFKDISERKQAEIERNHLLEQAQAAKETAEAANRIKDEFLAVLSHELRTPLNPILGWAKLLQTRSLSDAQIKQALATIERNAKLQVQLVDDLLDISRILRGKLTLDFVPVSLQEIIQAAMDTVRLTADAKSIRIIAELGNSALKVMGDAGRLQQVMWNLLSNAIKFTPPGGRVDIRLSSVIAHSSSVIGHSSLAEHQQPRTKNQKPVTNDHGPATNDQGPMTTYAQITITDTGKGIDPDFLPYVFEAFRQQDSSTTRQFGGLGLGLTIVRQLVEAHGGTIAVDSSGKGQGSVFKIFLPLIPLPYTFSVIPPSQSPLTLQGIRVLILDDETNSLEWIRLLLEQKGANVTAVASSQEVLQLLRQAPFDLLISNLGVPQMNGFGLLKAVRTLASENRDVPAIALTANTDEINQQQALEVGFQRYLAKPIDPDQLIQAMVDCIGKID